MTGGLLVSTGTNWMATSATSSDSPNTAIHLRMAYSFGRSESQQIA